MEDIWLIEICKEMISWISIKELETVYNVS